MKTKIPAMVQGGKKLARILKQVVKEAKPGVSLATLDNLAETLMIAAGGRPGFKQVPGYNWSTCINLNQGVVHGIPHANRKINSGDLVSLDMGLLYKGFHTDASTSFVVGKASPRQSHFLAVGQKALSFAIKAAKPGNRIGHISQSFQAVIEPQGFVCSRTLTGHGVGKKLHMAPMVPCFLSTSLAATPVIKTGMTLAIEIIYMMGDWATVKDPDGWTLKTADGLLSGLFEHTILVTAQGPKILTSLL